MATKAQLWNNHSRLSVFVGFWVLGWFLIFEGFIVPAVPAFRKDLVGGLEAGMVFLVGSIPGIVAALRMRRISKLARTDKAVHRTRIG